CSLFVAQSPTPYNTLSLHDALPILLDQPLYNAVFQHPDLRLTSKHLLLLAKKNNLTYPRLGLAISKKRASLAISRNHIKRQARRSEEHTSELQSRFDLVCRLPLGI